MTGAQTFAGRRQFGERLTVLFGCIGCLAAVGGREGKRKEGELPGCQHPAQVLLLIFQIRESEG